MRLSTLLAALFLTPAAIASPQASAPQQPGTISGKVVNAVTGQPVKKAVVTLRTANGQHSYVTGSDQSGKFSFDNIQPDNYLATAQAEGYATQMRTAGKPIAVAAQQQVQDVDVRISPLASISGKVVDEDGQPLVRVSVSAMRKVYMATGQRMQASGSAQTDDRGLYRIFDLQPGRYYLMATALNTMGMPIPDSGLNAHSTIVEEGYAPVYYPGVAELSQAAQQDVQPGADWSGADFKLRSYPAYHIRGHVVSALHGTGGYSIAVQRCEEDDALGAMVRSSLRVNQGPNLRFDALGAIAGTYCLMAIESPRGGIAARKTVTVKAGDVDDVELVAAQSFSVKGTVAIDGTPPANAPQLNIGLNSPSGQGVTSAQAKSDGSFQIDDLFPGSYTFFFPQQGQMYVKSILYGSQDVTYGVIPNLQPGVAITITVGTDPGQIDGTVQPGNVEAGMPVVVAAIPEDAFAARQDMQRMTPQAVGGSFNLSNVPPGNYKVIAMQSEDFSDAFNRDLIRLLEGKTTAVTVHAAGHEQVSVTAISHDEVEQARGKLK